METLLTEQQLKQIRRLRFSPPKIERAFWQDWAERIRRPAYGITVAGLALCICFVVATLMFPVSRAEQANNLTSAAIVFPILVFSFFFTKSGAWIRWNPVVLWMVVIAMSTANGYGLMRADQPVYERVLLAVWLFLLSIIVGSGLALFRAALVGISILVLGYLVFSFFFRDVLEPARTTNLIFLSQSAIFAAVGAYIAEIRARREFMLGQLLEEERAKSESLLANVLPTHIAQRLKTTPGVLAERHANASVLFADIVEFTPFAASRAPDEVVGFLDQIFSRIDTLVEQRGLEKIKTVGDAYMVAGGVLGDSKNHLDEMGDLSLEILRAAKEAGVQMRIGLHSGPLVAGVIGKKKFLYDLWGETVNLASRLESHGVAGQVQVTQGVADTMPDFRFKRRGEVDFKGVGLVETCFLVGRKGDD